MKNASGPALFCASLLFLSWTTRLEAQNSPVISLAAGAMQYSGSGNSTVPMIALRGAVPIGASWLLGEGNLTFASLREQSLEIGTRAGVAEGQLQVQLPFARVRPYLGVGAGWFHYFNSAVRQAETLPTYSAAAGLRVALSRRFGASAELRLRGMNYQRHPTGSGFTRSAAEWTGGWTYSF
jgi:hypothetical protein